MISLAPVGKDTVRLTAQTSDHSERFARRSDFEIQRAISARRASRSPSKGHRPGNENAHPLFFFLFILHFPKPLPVYRAGANVLSARTNPAFRFSCPAMANARSKPKPVNPFIVVGTLRCAVSRVRSNTFIVVGTLRCAVLPCAFNPQFFDLQSSPFSTARRASRSPSKGHRPGNENALIRFSRFGAPSAQRANPFA